MNELKHLKHLSEAKSANGINFLNPAVSPGTHCPMRMASVIVEEIKGLSSLLVGMPECTTHSRLFSPNPEGTQGELHWLYVLDAHEVVFGCREGLVEALHTMDNAGAKAILIIGTCVPELIGEDLEGMIYEIQPQIKAQLTFVMLGQFKNVSYPTGSWKTLLAMGALMAEKTTDPKRINVLGRSPVEEHIEMPSLLPAITDRGFSLSYLAPGANLDDFANGRKALLNLVVSPYAQPLAERMKAEFGIPYLELHNRYSVADIDAIYEELAKYLSVSWQNTFNEERQEVLALETRAKQVLNGLRFILALRIDLPLPLSVYLGQLGMNPMLLHLEEYYPEDKKHAAALMAMGYDPLICRMVNDEFDLETVEALSPDCYFGYLPDWERKIPCIPDVFDFYGTVGYRRTHHLLMRILAVIDNDELLEKGDR
jgi:Nitrogenase molybdenum-iron protein, alpha and beta chains